MKAENLGKANYYDQFEHGSGMNWDLKLMLSALDGMEVTHDDTFDALHEQPSANLLLGSATSQNLDNLALLEKKIRPGLARHDTAYVIDFNHYPLQKHQERADYLEEWEESNRKYHPDETNPLPYPDFELVQANMQRLPFGDGSIDVAVSDYTLNFVETVEEVEQTIVEVSRVLADEGFFFVSVRGNPDFPYDTGDAFTPDNGETAQTELAAGLVIDQLPLATYLGLAQKHGLQLVEDDRKVQRSEILCGVFQKEKPAS